MLNYPISANEEARLQELDRWQILYTEPDEILDQMTAEVARIFDVPMAEVTFIDRDTQYIKSHSLTSEVPKEIAEAKFFPRGMSPCAFVISENDKVVVGDMTNDARFQNSPITQMGARFYAGMPLRTGNGHALGTLCILDNKPRELTDRELKLLQMVADRVMSEIKLRTATRTILERSRVLIEDLDHARNVQRFLLPPAELAGAAFVFTHAYRPMDQIGGDFVDVKEWTDGSVGVLVADVSGHGASAALMSAMTKTAFVRCADKRCDPPHLLTNLNRSLAPTTEPGRFMTALSAIYDPATREVTMSSAGHPHPILVRNGKSESTPIIAEIPLLIDGNLKYTELTRLKLQPGDRLLLFTDGAVEARNADGLMLEVSGFRKLIDDAAGHTNQDFLKQLFESLSTFAGQKLNDDVAMACLQII